MPSTRSGTDRGYGPDHERERERWAPIVTSGTALCTNPHCTRPTRLIGPNEPWDLGHTEDRTSYRGPEHAACNRAEGGRNGAAVVNARRLMTIRAWGQR